MTEYPIDPAYGTTVINADTHELMTWDGSNWTNISDFQTQAGGYAHVVSGEPEPEDNLIDHMMAECSRYGFIATEEGLSYKISMPFEGNNVDMGYIGHSAFSTTGSTQIVDTILAELWRQAESEIKEYYKRR
jgi:hypothetical protein